MIRPERVVAPIEREGRQIDAHGARRRPFADDEVELEILHGRIEDLLHRRIQAMDLVDEQHVAGLQIGQQRRQIAGARDHGAGGGAEADAQLAGDDLGERRLAEARRPEEQHMVERLAAGAGGGDEDLEIGAQLLLADEILDRLGPERGVDAILGHRLGRHHARRRHWLSSCRPARISWSTGASTPSRRVAVATA